MLKPTENRVLLQRFAPEKLQSAAGLVIPDSAETKSQRFKVLAVGPGKVVNGVRIPMEVQVGDTVLLGKYAGTDVEVNGANAFIASEDEILAVLS